MTDLAKLFSEDPLQLTRADLSDMVATYQTQRKQFALGNMKAGTAKPSAKDKKLEAAATAIGGLKLDLKL